jgi:protein-disulfide isomerase
MGETSGEPRVTSQHWLTVLTIIMTVVASVAVAISMREVVWPSQSADGSTSSPHIKDWRQYAAVGSSVGDSRAPVAIVVFSDYQCPFCRVLNKELQGLDSVYPHRFRIVYRHYPLEMHPHAFEAAVSAVCADEQHIFPTYHDRLFAQQDSIGVKPWSSFARDAGVSDPAAFNACLKDPATTAVVARDTLAAARLGIRATPAILVDGTLFSGSPGKDTLAVYIDHALAEK